MLKKLPVQMLLCTVLAIALGGLLPVEAIRFFFSLSCTLKSILMALLPLMIFTFISSAILSLETKAPMLLLTILVMIVVSNMTALLVSYGAGITILPLITLSSEVALTKETGITALFTLPITQLLSPDKALLIGIGMGLLFTVFPSKRITTGCLKLRSWINTGLRNGVTPLLPLYIFGFILKLQYEGTMGGLITNFGQVFLLITTVIMGYVSLLYWVGSAFTLTSAKNALTNMLPAGLTAFSTISSAATMPFTMSGTEKNTQDPQFTNLVIPASVNNHLLGSTLGITLLGLASMLVLGNELPALTTYLVFITYFCLAALSAAGVPGGCIIVMLPVLERHLGLTTEMATLITALYLLMEPFFTVGNVMGNGAFALISRRLCRGLGLVKVPEPIALAA